MFSVTAQITKPNIVIFYVDDLGWQDTNVNNVGDPVPWLTPNIDALAAAGTNFSQAYSPAPTCAPSRSAMLSGRSTIKTRLTQVSGGDLPGLTKAKSFNSLIGPFVPLRLQTEEFTIAEALKTNGYTTGHVGKWHVEGANGKPSGVDQGFDTEFTGRGVNQGMDDRYDQSEFGGNDPKYPLDEDGIPRDDVTDNGISFLEDRAADGAPFFLYMATWLVHTPIQTRDLTMLQAISQTLVDSGQLDPADLFDGIPTEMTPLTAAGEFNPFFGAMVQTVDWSLGKIVDYLKATPDPRHAGKTLFETTYIIFSSDNGTSEQNNVTFNDKSKNAEVVSDNFPLDLGKTSSREGGVRVPLIITGPDVLVGTTSEVANGLDFYPTVLALTGTSVPQAISDDFDGADLTPLLKGTGVVVDASGSTRTDMIFHYPHGDDDRQKSSIRRGDYKIYKRYDNGLYEAFKLYSGGDVFDDIEEKIDVIGTMPTAIKDDMIATLEAYLTNNNAKFPTWNPDYSEADGPLPNQENVPSVNSTTYDKNSQIVTATISTEADQATIARGTILYQEAISEDEFHESSVPVTIDGNIVTGNVPLTATAVVFNMVDSNNFLVLSNEIETVPGEIVETVEGEIALLDVLGAQEFQAATNSAELLGDADIRGNSPSEYIQTRAIGGGAKFSVKAGDGIHSVICDKITFAVRSQEKDVIDFDIIIGGVTQNQSYTSTRTADQVEIDFNGPVTFTSVLQDVEIVTTDMSNDALVPRFRIYDIIFNVTETLLDSAVNTEIVVNDTDAIQKFDTGTDYFQLLPNTTVNSGGAFLQNIVAGGGATYAVKTEDNVASAVCTGVEFRVRAANTYTVEYDINFAGQSKSFEYTSQKTSTNVFSEFIFPTPITLTNQAQELEIVSTLISDPDAKFRIYDVTLTLEQVVLSSEDIEIDQTEGIKMFPNPVKDLFSLTEDVDSGIIYNIYGGKVYEFSNEYQNINISNLSSGLYILQITKEGNSRQYKLIKE